MAKIITSVLMLAVMCLSGCSGPKRLAATAVTAGSPDASGSPPDVSVGGRAVEYLHDQNLPALESAEVWQSDYGPGLKLTTAHYEIFTTLLEPLMLRRVPLFMESAYSAYNGEMSEPIETTTKFTVYLFADRQQWTAFTKNFAGEQAELYCAIKAGAYCHNGVCVAYNIGRKRTFSAIGHEGWHQFNSKHFKFRLPSWLDEGVAMLFESSRAEDGTFVFEPWEDTYRLDALRRTLRKNEMMPLKELISINPGEVLATNESEAIMAFYGQSYALVRFLREGGCGKRPGTYRQLLLDGLKGDWPLDEVSKKIAEDRNQPRTILWNRVVGQSLFHQYIGDDFEQVEQRYLAFCRQIIDQK